MHPEVLEPAMKQARHGRLGRVELGGDLGQRPALKVMQLDRAALAVRERGQAIRPSATALPGEWRADWATSAGRRASVPVARRTGPVPCSSDHSRRTSRLRAVNLRRASARLWLKIERSHAVVWASVFGALESVIQTLVGFQKRLLNDPREINLVAQPRSDLKPGQQPQIGTKPLQVAGPGAAGRVVGL